MSRLSYVPSPECNIIEQSVQGNENPAKKGVVNCKPCKEVKELGSEGGKQGVKSVQPNKKPAKKALPQPKPDKEQDNGKLKVAQPKPSKEVEEVEREEVKQDLNSVQPKKQPARKAQPKHSKEMNDIVGEQGNKSVQGKEKPVNKAVCNHKPDEKHDNNELATNSKSKLFFQTDSNSVHTAPEMTSLDIETPPTAQSSPKQSSVSDFVEENADNELICPCPFECGIEPCKLPLMRNHIIVNHGEHIDNNKNRDARSTFEEDNIIRKTFMLSTKGLLTCYKFNKLLRDNNFHEVIVPGNGYCYISALLITLVEQGVNKEMAVLAHKVMTEIRNHT